MRKKRILPKRVEPLVSSEPEYVEVFSLDPDGFVVPTSIGIPSWVYSYGDVLEKQIDAFLAQADPDAYNEAFMHDVIQAKLGEAKAAVYSQLASKLYGVNERRRAQTAKIEKLHGQVSMLEEELADYGQELSVLERAWDDRGPLM